MTYCWKSARPIVLGGEMRLQDLDDNPLLANDDLVLVNGKIRRWFKL
jgi:hypothetical protein